MNFVVAVLIGVVAGLGGWFLVKDKKPNAIWMAPVAGVIGAVAASAIATAVSEPGYGIKEIALQVALAVGAVALVAFLPMGAASKAE